MDYLRECNDPVATTRHLPRNCSVLQYVAVLCDVLQSVVVCCRVLQCVAASLPRWCTTLFVTFVTQVCLSVVPKIRRSKESVYKIPQFFDGIFHTFWVRLSALIFDLITSTRSGQCFEMSWFITGKHLNMPMHLCMYYSCVWISHMPWITHAHISHTCIYLYAYMYICI